MLIGNKVYKKICTKCKLEKPYTHFSRNKRNPDGHAHHCKNCSKIRLNKHLENPNNREKYEERRKNLLKKNSDYWISRFGE